MKVPRTVLWKRLDREGHDAGRFTEARDRRIVEGCAVFEHDKGPANLGYRLVCDRQWRSLEASVTGWMGSRAIDRRIIRVDDGAWRVDDGIRDDLTELVDIDLGFTPASNTNAIRRLDLREGNSAESTAVWLDPDDWCVKRLPQTYRRIGTHAYDYTSSLHGFKATLTVDDEGIVTAYPGLWLMTCHRGHASAAADRNFEPPVYPGGKGA